jgi:holliday junction DNA helicase RuvB
MILNKSILSKKPCHILLKGKPGCAKTMFLTEIMKSLKDSYFVVGSNATKAGLVNQLFERQPKFLLIDELDKMPHQDQTSLLHLMETDNFRNQIEEDEASAFNFLGIWDS